MGLVLVVVVGLMMVLVMVVVVVVCGVLGVGGAGDAGASAGRCAGSSAGVGGIEVNFKKKRDVLTSLFFFPKFLNCWNN